MAAVPATVPRARAILRQQLCEWQLEPMSDTALLLMSELVTNAVKASGNGTGRRRPARPMIRAIMSRTDMGLVLGVWDADPAVPVVQEADLTAESGRGLLVIEWLCDRWGHLAADGGKVVWCELAFPVSSASRATAAGPSG